MPERRTPSRLGGQDRNGDDTPPDGRFIRVPSIAERKLGREYVAPMRLDPRVLDQMQETIRGLETKYAEALKSQVSMLQILVEPACKGDTEARGRLYSLAHDMRGLAGTFGHPMVGRFADSLCGYLENCESEDWKDGTVIVFHVDAIRDAIENPKTDAAVTMETLDALERLIEASRRDRRKRG